MILADTLARVRLLESRNMTVTVSFCTKSKTSFDRSKHALSERERERQRETDSQRQSDRQTETDRQAETDIEREGETETETI